MDFNLNLTNYQDHPENKKFKVFSFTQPERAQYFEHQLIEAKITFEKDTEQGENGTYYLFAVHQKDFERALYHNHLTIGKYRSKFIPDVTFRYFVIIISLSIITLAVLGAILSD